MKLKGIVLAVILSLASIMMPFSVYAETIDSHIRGRNYTYEPITYNEVQVSTNTYYENIGIFHITFELDDEYIGYVLPNYYIQYDNYFYGASTPNWGTLTKTFDRRIFVNGSSFSFDISVNWNSITINSAPGGDPFNYDSYTITSSDVTKYADIDSLDQIINILQDNQDIITDMDAELETVVSNTSLANQYLETISKFRQYNMYIESIPYAYTMMYKYNSRINDLFNFYSFQYPVFSLRPNDYIVEMYIASNRYIDMVFMTDANISNITQFKNFFDSNREYEVELTNLILPDAIRYIRIIKLKVMPSNNANVPFRLYALQNINYIPIYCNRSDQNINLSTDFALLFGYSNSFLDDIHMIAQGTNQSNSAASDLESGNDQMADDMDDLATIENGYNQQFNNQLQQIDFTSPFQNNAGILPAANFVITIFNGLINNNPFSVMIIIVCILLIGKKVIGK